ncbi:MAG: M18 family aminopeptidase [Myxococcota bacterium]|nr:M18 family aminopeptidase [Myxococcota bacterium]
MSTPADSTDRVADLLRFVDRSPTPYHAVAEAVRRLEAQGFRALSEAAHWELRAGDACYVVRDEGSIAAFVVGGVSPAEAGFRIVGAHTDSPNLRVKPRADVAAQGYRQLAVEPYGGVLLHTWLDRDLSLAGRVAFEAEGRVQSVLLDFERPLLRVPNLAIHLAREIATDGLKLNAQKHALPVVGLEETPPLAELVAAELRAAGHAGLAAEDLRGLDLMAYDTQPSTVAGSRGEFVLAPRLDNLASCHAALSALCAARSEPPVPFTQMVVLYDHEEVGSQSARGAGGPFLSDTLARNVGAAKDGDEQGLARASARSLLISADMAHAVHPNYADRHDAGHVPLLGAGPVIKTNANQAYASDAVTAGLFESLCRGQGIEPQHFVSRSDLRCGSTIGPISAARVGIRTVDVGNPMLSMHSCREMAGAADVEPMIQVLLSFFRGEGGTA